MRKTWVDFPSWWPASCDRLAGLLLFGLVKPGNAERSRICWSGFIVQGPGGTLSIFGFLWGKMWQILFWNHTVTVIDVTLVLSSAHSLAVMTVILPFATDTDTLYEQAWWHFEYELVHSLRLSCITLSGGKRWNNYLIITLDVVQLEQDKLSDRCVCLPFSCLFRPDW